MLFAGNEVVKISLTGVKNHFNNFLISHNIQPFLNKSSIKIAYCFLELLRRLYLIWHDGLSIRLLTDTWLTNTSKISEKLVK